MKRNGSLVIALLLLALTTVTVAAQTGAGYDLTWSTVDGGGGTAAGGAYTLDGTIGQFDAGVQSGGSYTLRGGFWSGLTALPEFKIYLPLMLR